MLAPERRTRADVVVAAAILVAVLIAATVLWLGSDARGTTSITADVPAATPEAAMFVPETVQERWRAANGASRFPIVAGGTVVTADGGTVTGREPGSGAQTWMYRRDIALCGVIANWGAAISVYRDSRGCSQVTSLRGTDGVRADLRSSAADPAVRLSSDATYVVAQGETRLEVWRSDLVRTLEYGRVAAPQNPKSQPRSGCRLLSATSSGTRLSVLERCPGEDNPRLTVLNPAPKDNDRPEEYGSSVLTDLPVDAQDVRLLVTVGERTAIYLPGPTPRLGIFDSTANLVAQYQLQSPITDQLRVTKAGGIFTVWTGSDLLALNGADLTPMWVVPNTLGPATQMAGRMLVPVPEGIAVLDLPNGTQSSRIAVPRNNSAGPITLGVLGRIILEQRGNEVVALG